MEKSYVIGICWRLNIVIKSLVLDKPGFEFLLYLCCMYNFVGVTYCFQASVSFLKIEWCNTCKINKIQIFAVLQFEYYSDFWVYQLFPATYSIVGICIIRGNCCESFSVEGSHGEVGELEPLEVFYRNWGRVVWLFS